MRKLSIPRLAMTLGLMLVLVSSSVQAQSGCVVSANGSLAGEPFAGNLGGPIDNGILTEGAELSRLLAIDPAIFYMRESNGPNAQAVYRRFPDLLAAERRPHCCRDGSVLVGLELIQSEWAATGGSGLSIPAILAHEFAHISQFKYNFPWQGKWRELHADYIAGWFIAHRGRYGVANDAYQAMANFYYKGDYEFNNSNHHGTPAQRAAAFRAGFEFNIRSNSPSGALAYQGGIEYLKRCGNCR